MCYMNCPYERFDPITGICHCTDKSSNPCPHETPEPEELDDEEEEHEKYKR